MSSNSEQDEALTTESAARLISSIIGCDDPSVDDQLPAPRAHLPSLPGYTVERELGRGSGGAVYLARRAGSERPVAVKIMPSGISGTGRHRALRELDILGDIHHSNIVRVIDYGIHEGQFFIATEYIDGLTLEEHCLQNGLSLKERVKLLVRVADATHSLHEYGVIHRDIKPSNVMVDHNGQPVIIDLGVALLNGDNLVATLTQDGAPIGTPAFMSPEQARGERASISTRSDVYGLGALGYILTTGETPHLSDTTIHEMVRRVAQDPPREPRQIDQTIPKQLAAVLSKAVLQAPNARYESAAAMAADLRRYLGNEPVEAVNPGPYRKTLRWIWRHPFVSTSAASVMIAAMIIGGASLTIWKLNHTVAEIEVLSGGRIAILYARSGKPLVEWRSTIENGARYAQLIPGSKTAGRGRLAITSIHGLEGDPPWSNQVAVWDPDNLDKPLWHTTSDGPKASRTNLPIETKGDLLTKPEVYKSSGLPLIEDIFPNHPGHEIVTVQVHEYDPSVIRICSIDGDVLYEAWHWGAISTVVWMSDSRRLVFQASNNERGWSSRGYDVPNSSWPQVFGAITPREGERLLWVNPEIPGAENLVEWYKYFSPPESLAGVVVLLTSKVSGERPGSHVWLSLTLEDGSNLRWKLDHDGAIVGHSRNDPYNARLRSGEIIALENSVLEDWPPPEQANNQPKAEPQDENP